MFLLTKRFTNLGHKIFNDLQRITLKHHIELTKGEMQETFIKSKHSQLVFKQRIPKRWQTFLSNCCNEKLRCMKQRLERKLNMKLMTLLTKVTGQRNLTVDVSSSCQAGNLLNENNAPWDMV